MSTVPQSKEALLQELLREMRLMSSFDMLHSQAIAERAGMHATDIETMDLLNTLGPMTAGELSARTGLSSGATTRLIDRLERAGYVRRRHDESDRRRVIIEPAWENLGHLEALFEPLASGLAEIWSRFNEADLATILRFARESNAFVSERNTDLRSAEAD